MKLTKTWLGVMCSIATAWAGDVTPASIHEAATKAVAALQNSQKVWYTKETCASCHQQVFPAMAFRAAREHGIPVDEPAALADAQAAFGFYSDLARAVEYSYVIDPALWDGYSFLGADAAGVRPSLVMAVYARLLSARQEADGHWETFDERPPQSYSPFTATAISVRAIQLYSHASQRADMEARTARAKHWFLSHQPRCTEERAYQLMGAKWAGADDGTLSRIAEELKTTQQDDGGWNSIEGRASDAYSTGRALIALHDAGGVPTSDPAWRRGIEYLIRTQAADGTWHGSLSCVHLRQSARHTSRPAILMGMTSSFPQWARAGGDGVGCGARRCEAEPARSSGSGARGHRTMGRDAPVRKSSGFAQTAG